jgi:hypothetical protein
MKKKIFGAAISSFFLLLTVLACQPTKLMVARYNPNQYVDTKQADNLGLLYYLPKKFLRLEVTYQIFYKVKISEFEHASKNKYEVIDHVALVKDVQLRAETMADVKEAVFIKLNRPSSSSNSLNATVNFNEMGLLTSINTESEGKASEVFQGIAQTASSLVRMGTAFAAPNLLSARGESDGPNGPKSITVAIDTVNQKFTRVIEFDRPDTTLRLRVRDFMPDLQNGHEVRVILEGKNIPQIQNPLQDKNTFTEGVLYRVPVPVRTKVEVRGEEDYPMVREKFPQKKVIIDQYINYPQFGGYAIANLAITGGGKQVTNLTFYDDGGIKTYTIDKKVDNVEKNRQLQETLQQIQGTALDVKYGNNRNISRRRQQEIKDEELKILEAQIEQENKRQQLEIQLLELKQKRKELEEKKKDGKEEKKEEDE